MKPKEYEDYPEPADDVSLDDAPTDLDEPAPSVGTSGIPSPLWKAPVGWTDADRAALETWCAAADSHWLVKERQGFIAALEGSLGDKPHRELVNTLDRAEKNGFRDFFVARIRKQPLHKHARQDNEHWKDFEKKGLAGKSLTETERATLDAWCAAAADRDGQEYRERQDFIATLSQLLSDISNRKSVLTPLNRAGKHGFRDYFIGRIRKQWPRRPDPDEYDECWQAFNEKKLLQGTLLDNYDPAKGSLFNLLCGPTALQGHIKNWFTRLTKLPESPNITESGDDQEISPMESIPTDHADGLAERERNELVGRLEEFYRKLPPHEQIIMQYQWFDECPEKTKTQLAENIALIFENMGLLDKNGNSYSPNNIRQIINSIKRRLLVYFKGHIELISILRKP